MLSFWIFPKSIIKIDILVKIIILNYIEWITHEMCCLSPTVISAVVYIRIGFTIASLGNVCSVISEEQRNQLCYKKRRRILLLVLIVLIFGICWLVTVVHRSSLLLTNDLLSNRLPFHLYYLLGDFKVTKFNFKTFLMVSIIFQPFNHCNPIAVT